MCVFAARTLCFKSGCILNSMLRFSSLLGVMSEGQTAMLVTAYVVAFGPDSSVGIATSYGLDSSGIESRWGGRGGEIFRTCPDRPWGPPSLMYNGYRLFPGCKEPLLVPLVMKE